MTCPLFLYFLFVTIISNLAPCFFVYKDVVLDTYDLVSTKVTPLPNTTTTTKRSPSNEFKFCLKLRGQSYNVLLRRRKSDIIENLKVHLASESRQLRSELFEGYIIEDPHSTSVNGYLKDDCFYGTVIVNKTWFYVEELRVNRSVANAVVYRKEPFVFRMERDMDTFSTLYKIWRGKGRLCSLLLVVDYSFLTLLHGGNVDAAVFHVLWTVEEVNSLFRSTDFDGDGIPDNVGFTVEDLHVIDNPVKMPFVPNYTEYPANPGYFLSTFARLPLLKTACLGVCFTSQGFVHDAIGISFTPNVLKPYVRGGICETHYPDAGYTNSLLVTPKTRSGVYISQQIFEACLMHELGHSFGCRHDPLNSSCYGHVMSPASFKDYKDRTHIEFSECSKAYMIPMMVDRGGCFREVTQSFCGNGIVENDEECDCGKSIDCLLDDPCCVPRRGKGAPCKINRAMGHECDPAHGLCCTKNCKFNRNLVNTVNCQALKYGCPCEGPGCSCGVNGECLNNVCHSIECTRMGLEECSCPRYTLDDACEICCLQYGECLPSRIIANRTAFKIRNESSSTKFFLRAVNESICSGATCTTLSFHRSEVGGFCSVNGKLGRCDNELRCQRFFRSSADHTKMFFRDFVVSILVYAVIK